MVSENGSRCANAEVNFRKALVNAVVPRTLKTITQIMNNPI
jgi:hypothetical protein